MNISKTKKATVAAIILAATSTSAFAKEETPAYKTPSFIGLSSGVVAGSLIAGPAGAVVAGTLGLFIGNAKESEDKIISTEQELAKSNEQLTMVNQQKQNLLSNLHKSEQQNEYLNEQLNLAQNTINSTEALEQIKLNLQFKVNSSDVESFYQEQVKQLAQLVKDNPKLNIHLSGHADRNGDDSHNMQLSENRIESVKQLLINNGIAESNITTQAMGENSPMHASQNYQNDFYDRRVEIKLQPQQVLTAGN